MADLGRNIAISDSSCTWEKKPNPPKNEREMDMPMPMGTATRRLPRRGEYQACIGAALAHDWSHGFARPANVNTKPRIKD